MTLAIVFAIAIFLAVPAILWRLGGGAFTTLTGVELTTDEARLFRAFAGSLAVFSFTPPFSAHAYIYMTIWLAPAALYIGVMISGWGPFQGMGLPSPGMPEQSWMRWLPEQLGLKVGTLAHDLVGMAEAGTVCMAPIAVLLGFLIGFKASAIMLGAGVGFAPCYLLARLNFPTIPNFAEGQSWGEVFAGALIGAALGMATFNSAAWGFL